jgi:tetratricopeptide (TPR) repeat protein
MGHAVTLQYVLALVADGYLTLGRVDLALAAMERYQALLSGIGDSNSEREDLAFRGAVYAAAGRDAEALPLLEAVTRAHWASGRLSGGSIEAQLALGSVCQRLGRIDDAESQVRTLVETARTRDLPAYLARALHLLGDLLASREPERAEAHYRESLTIVEMQEMRPLQAHCHLGLGKLHRAMGRAEAAQSELSTAVRMLREMDLTHWLPDAEAELAGARAASAGESIG